ncbi:MAG TPA: DinB family protein, partial [Anaerolineales bacterium]|nr:DinB family protein [Anaerolineales bacterium]
EFLAKGLTKTDLARRLNETEAYLTGAFEKLTMEDLSAERWHPRHGNQVKVAWALLHALDHVATHLGQINITTQLWHQRSMGQG